MGIIMGADTATNTQPAASPGRYLQAYWPQYLNSADKNQALHIFPSLIQLDNYQLNFADW